MNIDIHHQCVDHDSYRAARIKSLFNVEQGANVNITANLPICQLTTTIGRLAS